MKMTIKEEKAYRNGNTQAFFNCCMVSLIGIKIFNYKEVFFRKFVLSLKVKKLRQSKGKRDRQTDRARLRNG